jgi:hypothetical protein
MNTSMKFEGRECLEWQLQKDSASCVGLITSRRGKRFSIISFHSSLFSCDVNIFSTCLKNCNTTYVMCTILAVPNARY